jgi:hypothetical protein
LLTEGYMKRAFLILLLVAAAGHGGVAHAQSKDGENRWVVVVNERSTDMMRLYASRTTTGDWEENILTRPIPAGASVRINFDDGTGACRFDFRAVFRDNQSVHMWSINVCEESYWRTTD